jgi:hypothetical protein
VPQGTIAEGRAAMTPLRLHCHGVPAAARPQGITVEQCLHLHAIVGTAWVIVLLYPTAAASELLVVDMLCATLLDIDLVHTIVPECSITGVGYNGMREATKATTTTTVVVAMA